MAHPIRIAIVGTGTIARVHAAALAGLDNAAIVAATDIDQESLNTFCREHAIPEAYPTSHQTQFREVLSSLEKANAPQ